MTTSMTSIYDPTTTSSSATTTASLSPTSVAPLVGEISSSFKLDDSHGSHGPPVAAAAGRGLLTLDEFAARLPDAIAVRKARSIHAGTVDDPVRLLFEQVQLERHDWEPFALFDPSRCYTRNLIATDDTTYTLLLLCWNPGKSSPIHDHPCDGCYMKTLEGQVQECRYECQQQQQQQQQTKAGCTTQDDRSVSEQEEEQQRPLVKIKDTIASVADGIVFIEDSQGYHKVGNPTTDRKAVTLHLYTPPFQRCKIWLNQQNGTPSQSCMCNYSEYGKRLA